MLCLTKRRVEAVRGARDTRRLESLNLVGIRNPLKFHLETPHPPAPDLIREMPHLGFLSSRVLLLIMSLSCLSLYSRVSASEAAESSVTGRNVKPLHAAGQTIINNAYALRESSPPAHQTSCKVGLLVRLFENLLAWK